MPNPLPRMTMNAAQHKIVNLLKTFFCSSVYISVCVFNVWPNTTLLPVWPRDTKRLDTPEWMFMGRFVSSLRVAKRPKLTGLVFTLSLEFSMDSWMISFDLPEAIVHAVLFITCYRFIWLLWCQPFSDTSDFLRSTAISISCLRILGNILNFAV